MTELSLTTEDVVVQPCLFVIYTGNEKSNVNDPIDVRFMFVLIRQAYDRNPRHQFQCALFEFVLNTSLL